MERIDDNYPMQLARSLMRLRRLSVHDVAERTGISLANIEAFLGGIQTTLSEKSFTALFSTLGVEHNGLNSERVHSWYVELSHFNNRKNLLPLLTALPLLGQHGAMALQRRRGVTPILIKAENIRVVLFVKGPAFSRPTVSDMGLTPGVFAGHDKTRHVPAYYQELIFTESLRSNYFDLILEGDFTNESIELLRITALEYDVTISTLMDAVTGGRLPAVSAVGEGADEDRDTGTTGMHKVLSLFRGGEQTELQVGAK